MLQYTPLPVHKQAKIGRFDL